MPVAPWTAPRTWATDEIVTATLMNTHVRDNETFLANPPLAIAQRTATQSLTNATVTELLWTGTDVEDTDAIHDPAVNSGRLICKTAGLYLVIGRLVFATNATGVRIGEYRLNGTFVYSTTVAGNSVTQATVTIVTLQRLAVNDYIGFWGYQSSGGSLNLEITSRASIIFMAL